MISTIFLCNKKYRSLCLFKRKGPSHLFSFPLDWEYSAMFTLLVWHTFILPQLSSPQVIYKKLNKSEIVSCVQSARRSGFPHDLQPPSSSFANKSSSTTRLPVTANSHFEKERTDVFHFQRFQHFRSAFFSFLATNFHLFFPIMPFQNAHFSRVRAFRQGKPPLYFVANYVVIMYRMRSAILRNHLNIEETGRYMRPYKKPNEGICPLCKKEAEDEKHFTS